MKQQMYPFETLAIWIIYSHRKTVKCTDAALNKVVPISMKLLILKAKEKEIIGQIIWTTGFLTADTHNVRDSKIQ